LARILTDKSYANPVWILRTGAPWKDLPVQYPPYQTCHRWFQKWVQQGVFEKILTEIEDTIIRQMRIASAAL
jgi:transposase